MDSTHQECGCGPLVVATSAVLALVAPVAADDFHVTVGGLDDPGRDGRSLEAAWASLAFACERVPAGDHRILVGPGAFVERCRARPKAGIAIEGTVIAGAPMTFLRPAPGWHVSDVLKEGGPPGEHLIVLEKVRGVRVRGLALASDPDHRLTGGIFVRGCEDIELAELEIREFRWAGIHLERSSGLEIRHCRLHNASTEKHGCHNGQIRSRWIRHSRIHHNVVTSDRGAAAAYKGGGHEAVRLDHNVFDVAGGCSIESARENEFGLEIDHNVLTRCVSVPQGPEGADPGERGFEFSVWIHHNRITDGDAVAGPRDHLRVSHNHIDIARPNGCVYTHRAGTSRGPVWIDHNVVENLDRSFVRVNKGRAENIRVDHNTVFCSRAGDRAGGIFGAPSAEHLGGWVVRNNVFVAGPERPRRLVSENLAEAAGIAADHNLCVNVSGVPAGNQVVDDPGLRADGARPWPWFAPEGEASPLVDSGVDAGFPSVGSGPDVGAFELGGEPWRIEDLPKWAERGAR